MGEQLREPYSYLRRYRQLMLQVEEEPFSLRDVAPDKLPMLEDSPNSYAFWQH